MIGAFRQGARAAAMGFRQHAGAMTSNPASLKPNAPALSGKTPTLAGHGSATPAKTPALAGKPSLPAQPPKTALPSGPATTGKPHVPGQDSPPSLQAAHQGHDMMDPSIGAGKPKTTWGERLNTASNLAMTGSMVLPMVQGMFQKDPAKEAEKAQQGKGPEGADKIGAREAEKMTADIHALGTTSFVQI